MIASKETPIHLESERVYPDITNQTMKLIKGSKLAEKIFENKRNSGVTFVETERLNANNQR